MIGNGNMKSWGHLKIELNKKFNSINNTNCSRDKIPVVTHTGSISAHNAKMEKIFIYIPSIRYGKIFDCYTRGLKKYTLFHLWTNTYTYLNEVMADSLDTEVDNGDQ